jgi:ATP-dependent Zn protease
MDERELVPCAPERLALDGGPQIEVKVSRAAADHLVAWDVDQRVKAVHEAGHVVAAAVLGIPVVAVDISDRLDGRTEFGLNNASVPSTTTDRRLLDQVVVALAGPASERAVMGQATTGGSDDLLRATQLVYQRFEAGLDPTAPFIHPSGVPYNLPSNELAEACYHAALSALAQCRDHATAVVIEQREAVLFVANAIYTARRLSGAELEATLAAAGLSSPRGETATGVVRDDEVHVEPEPSHADA